MSDEVLQQDAIPAAGESQEQEHQPDIQGSAEGTEQTAEVTETPEASAPEKKTPWWQRRFDELTREKHEAERKAEAFQRQLEAYSRPTEQYDPNATQQQPLTQAQIDAMVEQRLVSVRQQEAAQAQAAEFNKACNTAYEQGKSEFNDFDDALSTLGMVGITQPVLDAAVRMDGGHRVLHYLGQNPDVAADLLSLNPVQLGIRMAELKATVGKSSKPVSNAPKPLKPVDGRGGTPPADIYDDRLASDTKAWIEARNKQLRGR